MRDVLRMLAGDASADPMALALVTVLVSGACLCAGAAAWYALDGPPPPDDADEPPHDEAAAPRDSAPSRQHPPLSLAATGDQPGAPAPPSPPRHRPEIVSAWYCPACGAAYVDDAGCDDCGPGMKLRREPPSAEELGPMVLLVEVYAPDQVETLRLELEAAAIPVQVGPRGIPGYQLVLGPAGATRLLVPTGCLRRARAVIADFLDASRHDDPPSGH